MTTLKAPELLLPAGSLDKMRAAYDFGADAVYAGQPRYSLRARNNEFKPRADQARALTEAHARGKKFFVTSNLIAHNDKIRTYLRDIEPVIDCKPDALIMADAGLIMMVKRKVARAGGAPLGAGQHHQLGGGEVLAKDGRGAHHPLARTQPGRDRKNPPTNAPTWSWKCSCTARCASRTRAAACSAATSTTATPTRAPAPTPAAGTTPRTTPTSTPPTGEAIAHQDGRRLQLRGRAARRPSSPSHRPPVAASATR